MRNWWFRIGTIAAISAVWGANPSLSGWTEGKRHGYQDLQSGADIAWLALRPSASAAKAASPPVPLIVADTGPTGPTPAASAGNFLADVPEGAAEEQFTDLLKRPGVRIERIVSDGQASPPGFWYDQGWDEWVLVVSGSAGLQIEGEAERRLKPGDYILLPAHTRHRVNWTDPDRPTVWLAVHIGEAN
ncbi:cupin domain-containing protein [Bauldia sp.]|uniref:cupin domain-containing protein n=1 Tax=Bauldia sp. TaxID=2575872 RepID=UPI003BACE87F